MGEGRYKFFNTTTTIYFSQIILGSYVRDRKARLQNLFIYLFIY